MTAANEKTRTNLSGWFVSKQMRNHECKLTCPPSQMERWLCELSASPEKKTTEKRPNLYDICTRDAPMLMMRVQSNEVKWNEREWGGGSVNALQHQLNESRVAVHRYYMQILQRFGGGITRPNSGANAWMIEGFDLCKQRIDMFGVSACKLAN